VQRFTDVESLLFRDAAEIDAAGIEGKPQAQPPRRRGELREAAFPGGAGLDLDGLARAAVLSDVLLAVYCVLRERPDEEFGGETSGRKRYAHMGAPHRLGGCERRGGHVQASLAFDEGGPDRARAPRAFGLSRTREKYDVCVMRICSAGRHSSRRIKTAGWRPRSK
jgi:hypothetical protein